MSDADISLENHRLGFADRATQLHAMLADLIDAREREKGVAWAIKLRMQDLGLSRLELEAKKKRAAKAHMATQVQGTADAFYQDLDNSEDIPRDIPRDMPRTGEEKNRVDAFEKQLDIQK